MGYHCSHITELCHQHIKIIWVIIGDECHTRVVVTLKIKRKKQKALTTSSKEKESTLSVTKEWSIAASNSTVLCVSLPSCLLSLIFSTVLSRSWVQSTVFQKQNPHPLISWFCPLTLFSKRMVLDYIHTHMIIIRNLFINAVVMKFCMLV